MLPALEGNPSPVGADAIVAAAQRLYPAEQVKYLIWDEHDAEPGLHQPARAGFAAR